MKMKIRLICFFIALCSMANGQMNEYSYKRQLIGVKDQWHTLILPNEIFDKASANLNDIRIYGIDKKNDTLEIPYILRLSYDKINSRDISFNRINESKNEKGYFFGFEIPGEKTISSIKLDFKQQNFDWKVKLEASQNQNEWFTIVDDYRILSIKTDKTDYKYTEINFSASNYLYYRLQIYTDHKPELLSVTITDSEIIEGKYRQYDIGSIKNEEIKSSKQSILSIDLGNKLQVCKLKIFVKASQDYYRRISIKYLSDSTKTEQGWIYNYTFLQSGLLNSIVKNEFVFTSTLLQKIKIEIDNQDNKALEIDSVHVMGYEHELTARFTGLASYYLCYSNNKAQKPQYDIDRFEDKIPEKLSAIELDKEEIIIKDGIQKTNPLFQNKAWLWAIMILIILILGWFSMKMIKKV